MNSNVHIAEVICGQLEEDRAVALATIVDVRGSSPRHLGAKMVVTADGKSHGTIGGSLIEADAIKIAGRVLAEQKPAFVEFDLATVGPDSAGMICGGKAAVLLDFISTDKVNLDIFRCWREAALAGTSFFFLTYLHDSDEGMATSGHTLLFPRGETVGNAASSIPLFETVKEAARAASATTVIVEGNTRVIIDPVRKAATLYCFGAGHVALPTARIAAMAGFRIVVIDDRAEYANAERFPDAERTGAVKDYAHAFDGLEIDGDSFVVIMTRGHQFDRVVLEQALFTPAGYIGMISSHRKRDAVFQELLAKGFKKKDLARVHAPIGIDIGSETPEEIAVSIVAQLIKVRAGKKG